MKNPIPAEQRKNVILILTLVFAMSCARDFMLYMGWVRTSSRGLFFASFNPYTAAIDTLILIFLLWQLFRLPKNKPPTLTRAEKKKREY